MNFEELDALVKEYPQLAEVVKHVKTLSRPEVEQLIQDLEEALKGIRRH